DGTSIFRVGLALEGARVLEQTFDRGGLMTERLRRLTVAVFVALSVAALAPARAQASVDPVAVLRRQIIKALLGSTSHLEGFYVTVAGLKGAAQLNAETPVTPASNEKIYTGLPALLQLSPSFQRVTTVRRTGTIQSVGHTGDRLLQGSVAPC